MTVKRQKMHQDRRTAFRVTYAFLSAACMTCGLEICWSAETGDKDAGKATMGHVVAVEAGGKNNAQNIGAQCWACNWDAKTAGRTDLTRDILKGALRPWVTTAYALSVADVRTRRPVPNLPSWAARRAARKARGLTW